MISPIKFSKSTIKNNPCVHVEIKKYPKDTYHSIYMFNKENEQVNLLMSGTTTSNDRSFGIQIKDKISGFRSAIVWLCWVDKNDKVSL